MILLYDQLIFRPLVVWGDRFRVEQEPGGLAAALLGADHDAALAPDARADGGCSTRVVRWTSRTPPRPKRLLAPRYRRRVEPARTDLLWFALLRAAGRRWPLWRIARMLIGETTLARSRAGGGPRLADACCA